MSTVRAPKPPDRFALPEGVPELVRAASLALAVARYCKTNSWAEFVKKVEERDDATLLLLAKLDVDAEDSALVQKWDKTGILRLLQVKPTISVAVCPDCGGWLLISGATPPSKCRYTLRCNGKPVKASIATKEKPAKDANSED